MHKTEMFKLQITENLGIERIVGVQLLEFLGCQSSYQDPCTED